MNRFPRGTASDGQGGGCWCSPAYRTPADDAPSFSPVYWRDQDVSYISCLAQQNYLARAGKAQQDIREYGGDDGGDSSRLFPSSRAAPSVLTRTSKDGRRSRKGFLWGLWELLWPSAPPLPSDQYASFHTIPHYTPHSFFDKVLAFFHLVDIRNRQGNLTVADIKKVGTDELLSLMQLALAAGERERSSFIARELSSRRVAVDFAARQPPTEEEDSSANEAPWQQQQQQQQQWPRGDPPRMNGQSAIGGGTGNDFATTSQSSSPFFGSLASRNAPGNGSSFLPAPTGEPRRTGRRAQGLERSGFAGLNTSTDFFAPSPQQQQVFHQGPVYRDGGRSSVNTSRGPEEEDALYVDELALQRRSGRRQGVVNEEESTTQIYPSRRQGGGGGDTFAGDHAPAWGVGSP